MNKPLSKKAARIAETAKKSGGMFVFATRDPKLIDAPDTSAVLSKFKYTQHACSDCNHSFMAVAAKGLQYHCGVCGSGKTEASATVAKLDLPTDDKLTLVTCASCNTHNIMGSEVVASVSQMCCTACGHEMNYKHTASDEDFPDGDDEADDETADADEMPMNDMDPITDVDDMDLVDLDDDGMPEDDSGAELFEDEATASAKDKKPTKHTAADDDKYGIPSLEDNGMAGDNNPDPDPVAESRKNKVENMSTDESLDIEVDLVDVVTERPTPEVKDAQIPSAPAIAFVYLGQTMNVAHGNTIIATLTPELAGDNAELMFNRSFQVAVKNSIETLGLKEALKTYNFQSAKIKVKVGKEVAKRVKDGIAAESAKVTAGLTTMAEDFQQSLDIAAAGFAQNFWRNHTSPVKAALITELAAAGLKGGSAEKLVDRVFAAHGVAELRTMLEVARDLAAKPVEARNGLAEAVNLTKYLPYKAEASAEEADAGEDEAEDNEDVVATVATPVSHVDKSDNQVTAHYKSPELAAILGGKTFSS